VLFDSKQFAAPIGFIGAAIPFAIFLDFIMTTSKHVAVIGANFGDEGKGQLVDYFASTGDFQTVVRFNGGSQAGHTVCTPDGETHIFSQLGSGSFLEIPTHLSRFMYINPVYLVREVESFFSKTGLPVVLSIDPRAQIVVSPDIIANQQTESSRERRHGSTGHGVFNAINRHLTHPELSLTAWDLFAKNPRLALVDLVKSINSYYTKFKIKDFWEDELIDSVVTLRNSPGMIKISLSYDSEITEYNRCIFEGAQGLLLDQNSGFFPHVTPSNTGLTNILSLMNDEDSVKPIYVTRSFLTRHGEGPLYFNEHESVFNYDVSENPSELNDTTNSLNPWQGEMRYGKLNTRQLLNTINKDYQRAIQTSKSASQIHDFSIAMTWMNLKSQTESIQSVENTNKLDMRFFGKTRIDIL